MSTLEKVQRAMASALKLPLSAVTPEARISELLGLNPDLLPALSRGDIATGDSLDLLEVMTALEEIVDLDLPDDVGIEVWEPLIRQGTIQDLADLIEASENR